MKTLGKIIVWLFQVMMSVYWLASAIDTADWLCGKVDEIFQKRLKKKTDKNDGWRFDID